MKKHVTIAVGVPFARLEVGEAVQAPGYGRIMVTQRKASVT